VSIVFIDKANKTGKTVLVDASNLGTKIKEDKNQKTLLSKAEEQMIIDIVNNDDSVEGFSVVKAYDELKAGKYSFNPGSYFDVKIEYTELSHEEFSQEMNKSKTNLTAMFKESKVLEEEIIAGFGRLQYERV
jgi:type I restriction enzyme M protein